MSLLKKLFGRSDEKAAPGTVSEQEIDGFLVRATPRKEGAQFRLCGVIGKRVDGADKEHVLIRADMFATAEQAAEGLFLKARRLIEERGDALFD